ncbi:Enolase-like ENO4 [Sesbania bispinosa]|nr:Enolase-like ENO4 [Sesbania bispinosa]
MEVAEPDHEVVDGFLGCRTRGCSNTPPPIIFAKTALRKCKLELGFKIWEK